MTFELAGDATTGWFVSYPEEATSQGSGEPIEVAGEELIAVSLRNVSYPPELPADVPAWDGEERIEALADAAVLDEVVADTTFEGIHRFYLGVDGEEVEHRIARLDEPQRVVVDLVHP